MNGKAIALGAVMLILGLAVGFFVGRATLESEWSKTTRAFTPDEAGKAGADAPRPGARVLVAAPLRRARAGLEGFTKADPVVITMGSFGRGEEPTDLSINLRLENRGKCEVSAVEGVLYAYTAWGTVEPFAKGGLGLRGFHLDKLAIAPGAHDQAEIPMQVDNVVSVVIGHVDAVTCKDGTRWQRPGA